MKYVTLKTKVPDHEAERLAAASGVNYPPGGNPTYLDQWVVLAVDDAPAEYGVEADGQTTWYDLGGDALTAAKDALRAGKTVRLIQPGGTP